MKFKPAFAKVSEENEIGVSSSKKPCPNIDSANESKKPCFLHNFNLCTEKGDHNTSIDPNLLERKFDVNFLDKFSDRSNVNDVLCHIHYNALSNFKREISQHVECVICEKSSSKRFISIIKENVDIFTKYLRLELQHDTDLDTTAKLYCCSLCYKNFNAFCRSDAGEDLKYQTSQYMCEHVPKFKFDESVSQDNIDLYTFEQINDIVLEPLLLPNIYEQFKQYLLVNIAKFQYAISETDLKKLQHNNKWIFRMLKIRFSKCLQVFVPNRKQDGRLIYRNGMNLINCLHSLTVKNSQLICEKNDISEQLIEKNSTIIALKNKVTPKHEILSEALQILRSFVKSYTADSFVVASFDNLDKNQSYSVVGVGKDKSGFHGTTTQAVTPCPSLLTSISSAESCGTGLDDSAVPLLVGGISSEASVITSDIDSSSCEMILPTKKKTVLKVLNILHDKFEIGKSCNYIVVVGDGKSYDHLIKLKSEYGANLSWVLPYPGDWHILKNLLPIFMKVYLDAGLKQLASKLHHGSTYRILTDCTKFAVTHRFLLQVWEAMLRYQVNSFLTVSDKIIDCKTSFEHILDDIFSSLNLNSVDEANNCNIDSLWTEICSKKIEIFSAFSNDLLSEFRNWRYDQSSKSDTFSFWDSFIHTDFMNYLGFYVAIRTRNWELRNACLKQLACLFHAFDRHNYLRMIPYHLADLQNFPPDVLDFF
ncbi:unnamed protein product [Mytilus coruscus]|uniref:DUF6589 domain-containing protein n=1 Tax=Mytilus coruscus TaxID=42192 RepID=A0A6J7ZZY0_MYTCO|nr:unnamed protein product [Mytilus coruscus]